jgi:leucyl-tRNA synthetase
VALTPVQRRKIVDGYRLAYQAEALVNWCPALGTVLASEEITADGRSNIGNYPVYRRPLRQWMLRITAYAERLLRDLGSLDWNESIKTLQRNWIGPSDGAEILFSVRKQAKTRLTVFTTRPDTLPGATYLVLAPEHPMVDALVADPRAADAVRSYREHASRLSDRRRVGDAVAKTGVFTGSYVTNPMTGKPGLRRRLRAHGLRHRGSDGSARARPAGHGVRPCVRPAGRGSAGFRGGSARPRPCDHGGHPLAGGSRRGQAAANLPAARLAVLAAALLGRADPGCLRRARAAGGAARGNAAGRREPFKRLFNQGYILADAYLDSRGMYVPADEVRETPAGGFSYRGRPVTPRAGKMGKSLRNSVSPDGIYGAYGADTLRLYEMSMGPLNTDRPWQPDDISGAYRFLQRLWRNVIDERTGQAVTTDAPLDAGTAHMLHRTIKIIRADFENLRFNTAIARLTELNNYASTIAARDRAIPRALAEPLVLMAAPLVPHAAEEIWSRLGTLDRWPTRNSRGSTNPWPPRR